MKECDGEDGLMSSSSFWALLNSRCGPVDLGRGPMSSGVQISPKGFLACQEAKVWATQ